MFFRFYFIFNLFALTIVASANNYDLANAYFSNINPYAYFSFPRFSPYMMGNQYLSQFPYLMGQYRGAFNMNDQQTPASLSEDSPPYNSFGADQYVNPASPSIGNGYNYYHFQRSFTPNFLIYPAYQMQQPQAMIVPPPDTNGGYFNQGEYIQPNSSTWGGQYHLQQNRPNVRPTPESFPNSGYNQPTAASYPTRATLRDEILKQRVENIERQLSQSKPRDRWNKLRDNYTDQIHKEKEMLGSWRSLAQQASQDKILRGTKHRGRWCYFRCSQRAARKHANEYLRDNTLPIEAFDCLRCERNNDKYTKTLFDILYLRLGTQKFNELLDIPEVQYFIEYIRRMSKEEFRRSLQDTMPDQPPATPARSYSRVMGRR